MSQLADNIFILMLNNNLLVRKVVFYYFTREMNVLLQLREAVLSTFNTPCSKLNITSQKTKPPTIMTQYPISGIMIHTWVKILCPSVSHWQHSQKVYTRFSSYCYKLKRGTLRSNHRPEQVYSYCTALSFCSVSQC